MLYMVESWTGHQLIIGYNHWLTSWVSTINICILMWIVGVKSQNYFQKTSFCVVLFVLSDWHKLPKFDYITYKEETHTTYSSIQGNSPWPRGELLLAVSLFVRRVLNSLLKRLVMSNNRTFWINDVNFFISIK